MQCNCENGHCPHGERACEATAGLQRVLYLGRVCDPCFDRMPVEYRAPVAPTVPGRNEKAMTQVYSDPKRASDPHALPDVEVFYVGHARVADFADVGVIYAGYYWWSCFPGCLPDGEPSGPFATEAEAIADAQDGAGE